MGNLQKNIQLMLEFLKGSFLVTFPNALMAFLMISVLLLSMLMILLSTLNVIRYLICGNSKRHCGLGQEVWSFFLLTFLCVSVNLPHSHVWNTVSGLVLLIATWNYWIRYKIRYAGLLVIHLLPLLNACLIVEM